MILQINRVIPFSILFILLCIPTHAEEITQSPYRIFGDSTPVLDVPHSPTKQWSMIVTQNDSINGVVVFVDNLICLKDSQGDTVYSSIIDSSCHAIFLSVDSETESSSSYSPYIYCFGNPQNLVDESGNQPSPLESALMCGAVYRDEDTYDDIIKELEVANWKVSTEGANLQLNHPAGTGIGVQSMVFERETDNGKEYAYVFAGTNSWEDAVEDVLQLVGLSAEYAQAVKNARDLVKQIGGKELTFVGHSMGAGNAAAASMATGRPAITFNPAAVSFHTRLYLGLKYKGDIVNYISSTPKIPILNIHIPIDPITLLQKSINVWAPGEYRFVPMSGIYSHSIYDIIKALRNKP